jgi:hypothetical protein
MPVWFCFDSTEPTTKLKHGQGFGHGDFAKQIQGG